MRRILPLTLLALTLVGGVATADRHRGGDRGDRGDRGSYRGGYRAGGGVVVRDHRDSRPVVRQRRVVTRQPIYVNNGRYVFAGGVSRAYVRPVISTRYYNYRVRPSIIVENYDPVPGSVWVAGTWRWNGFEWVWGSGYYAPDARVRVYYDDGSWE
jgi:hypothetical protein